MWSSNEGLAFSQQMWMSYYANWQYNLALENGFVNPSLFGMQNLHENFYYLSENMAREHEYSEKIQAKQEKIFMPNSEDDK